MTYSVVIAHEAEKILDRMDRPTEQLQDNPIRFAIVVRFYGSRKTRLHLVSTLIRQLKIITRHHEFALP